MHRNARDDARTPDGAAVAPVELDLGQCAREPIHVPGAIQPHGALLVATPDGARITHVSANLEAFVGLQPRDVLGKPLTHALPDARFGQLLNELSDVDTLRDHRCQASVRHGVRVSLRAFRSAGRLYIDVERLPDDERIPQLANAHAVFDTFRHARSVRELCDQAVQGLRSIAGYDRVMAYCFGPDGHGEVIAEARAEDMEAYLGQRYPASDIPEQARRLYLRQRVGVIVDASYEPVPLLVCPGLADDEPVDLTHSTLRSVSPVHREFMRNMGTAASMTIGLERSGHRENRELWGMLVCHHRTPHLVGPEVRAVADLIGQMLAMLIGHQIALEDYTQQVAGHATLAQLIARLAGPDSIIDALLAAQSELLGLVNASGVVIRLQGKTVFLGCTPAASAIDTVFALLSAESAAGIVAVDDLTSRDPTLGECAALCSGALLMPFWKDPDDAILWIRPELAHTVTWGGNPSKAVQPDAGTGRMSPRASFAAWREVVRGRSQPWSTADRSLALELRVAIEAEIARRTKLVLDLFGRIFQSSPVALLLIDRAGRIKMANRETERIFGYEVDELLGKQLEELVPKRFGAAHVAHRRDYLAKPSLRKMGEFMEISALRKDGTEFPVEITVSPVTPQDVVGEPLLQASITDLTVRRASELAKRSAQQRLQSIAKHVPAMIGYWNRELRCEFANDAYRDWLGRQSDAIVGMSMRDVLDEELLRQDDAHIRSALAGVEVHFERSIKKPEGGTGYAEARYLPDIDERGTVRGFYVLVVDVSTLTQARLALEATNSELAHTNRELDQFVYTASHDLRSPLRAINSLVQFVLEDDSGLQAETAARLQLIAGRSRRMQTMLDQILEYARAGKDRAGGAPLEVGEIIDDVASTLDLAPDFKVVKDASLRSVVVHPMPMYQVLQNLIGNAIKHHDRTCGTVTVSVRAHAGAWRFTVSDDGPGIPAAYRESVFEMFTTLKRRDEVEASGMGLALVRKLVHLHGGQCGVDPTDGRGARIWFDWPVNESKGMSLCLDPTN